MDPINPIAGNPEALNSSNHPTIQPSSHSSNITVISMAVFILMSLTIVGFLYYQNQQLKSMLAKYQTPASSPTPTITADPTANWKIYTNPEFSLSLKYPDSLVLENFYDSSTGLPDKNVLFGFEFRDSQTKLDVMNFTIYKAGNKNLFPQTPKDVETSMVGGFNSTSFQNSNTKFVRFINSSGQIFQLEILNLNSETINLADQILSTFQFISPTPSPVAIPPQKACTQEAKLCPDGSSVGRTGPNCEFASCPNP